MVKLSVGCIYVNSNVEIECKDIMSKSVETLVAGTVYKAAALSRETRIRVSRSETRFSRERIALLRKMGAYRNKSDTNRTHPSQIELNRALSVSNRGKSRTNRSSRGLSKSSEVDQ